MNLCVFRCHKSKSRELARPIGNRYILLSTEYSSEGLSLKPCKSRPYSQIKLLSHLHSVRQEFIRELQILRSVTQVFLSQSAEMSS